MQSAIDTRDTEAIVRLVVAGTSTRVRQAAAHAIDDPELLRQLLREVRGGNDKNVYKILASKRDMLAAQARRLEQLQAEISEAAEDLERHSQRPYDALYGPRLEQFARRWDAVAAQADAELRDRAGQWLDRSRRTLAEHLREAELRAAREQAAASAAAEARRQRDEQAQAVAAAAAEQARIEGEQQRALAEKQHSELQAVRQIGTLVRSALDAVAEGSTARAAGMRRAIEEQRAAAPLPAHLVSQIHQLDKQLAELKDWKSFSVAPKRAELIEAMEALIAATLEPQALANRIRKLQDQWRALSKGAGENLEADWQRFHAAAQKAYQPCSEYFAAQALVREQNLRRREALIDRLAAFESGHNWEQPDWRTLINTLRETREEWRRCSPVERKAGKPQEQKFAAATAVLQSRLDAEYARNQAQKESLIARARQLVAGDESRKAIDAIKDLQQKWQAVGPVPRALDQRLWEEFRQHCDAVFQKRQQEAAAYTAGLADNQARGIALCEQLEAIAALEGPELQERARTLADLRRAFEALGEFPRAESRALHSRFERGLDRCKASLARQHARDAEQGWQDLFEAARQVCAYQLALVRGLDATQRDRLKAAAEAGMTATRQWPRGGLEALRQALAREHSADLAAHEAAVKLLCVRAEILADMPTPPEDQALRREYQLQRLVQSMGQGSRADETSLDALAIEWVGAGPVEEAVYQSLLQRFRRCREGRPSTAPVQAQ